MSRFLFCDFGIPNLMEDKEVTIGGATIQAYQWMQALVENGHEVGVMVPKGKAITTDSPIQLLETFSLSSKNPFAWLSERPKAMEKAIQEFAPDYLVQAGAGFILYPLAVLAKRNNIRLIHRIANNADLDERLFKKASFFAARFFQWGLKKAPIISCQNSFQFNILSQRFPEKKIVKLHNPFDNAQIADQRHGREERNYIAWLGVFQYQKNMPLLYEICKSLPEVAFKIAGKSSSKLEIDEVKEAVTALKNLPNVTFVGYLKRTDVVSFLKGAVGLLNTSRYEGFSNTFLESFAAGTPVITLQHNDPDQLISLNQLGFIGKTSEELTEKVIEATKTDSFDSISLHCQEYIRNEHDRNQLAKKLVNFLEEATKD